VLTAPAPDPIFARQPDAAQIAAASRFLKSVRSIGVRFAGQENLVDHAQLQIDVGAIDARRAVLLAVGIADYCLFDEMRPTFDDNYPWSDGAAAYYRFYAYNGWIPPSVIAALTTRHQGFRSVLIGTPDHVFDLAKGGTGQGWLTPELAYWVDHTKPLPPCCVPRQVLCASLLECGINPFDGWVSAIPARTPRSEIVPRQVKRSGRLIRRLTVGHADSGAVLQRTAQHWGAILAEATAGTAPPAILTSSGSAANEAVILSLSRISQGTALVDPSWYFENVGSVTDRHFAGRTSEQVERCSTFFVSLEPITFCRPISSNERPGNALPLLEAIARLAGSTPGRTYHLALDVTASPCLNVSSALSRPLPPNVVLYKTNSITKHQNGSRNYTCGAISICTPNEPLRLRLERDLLEARTRVGGEIHPIHALNIPRTSRMSIERKRLRVSRLNQAIARALDPIHEGRVVPYTYHSFLLPSRQALRTLAHAILTLALAGGLRSRREFELKAGRHLHERNRLLAARLLEIEYGNSFGLPRSRIFGQDCASLQVSPGLCMSVSVFRLCPGYEADERRLIEEARLARGFLEESFGQLAEIASNLREKVTHAWILHG
jgi:hypothetical protein